MYETIRNLICDSEFSVIESFTTTSRPARHAQIPRFLFNSEIGDYLNQFSPKMHSDQQVLWTHQSQALEALGGDRNVVVSTGTASGKSLVFRALALHKLLLEPSCRIVVFYPLRALVEDQLLGWQEITRALDLDASIVGRIDGTIPVKQRDDVLRRSRVILMTPDVCQAWLMSRLAMPVVKRFLGALSMLVMDEAHTLEGVFGSNFAFLIRRLIAARDHLLGKQAIVRQLQLVAATATIENPGEHMKRLTGKEFSVIGDEADGAPHYERIVAHIACSDGEQLQVARELQRHVLANGSDGGFITFVDSRKGVETLAMTTQHEAAELLDDASVLPYRAGYRQEDRQKIEKQLQSGELRGIVSTSALELGINLPHLRVGFNVGVPLTRKAYRQRLGRVGRTGPGAFVIIGPPDAFSRYGTTLQEYHERSVEPSYLYLDNRFMQFAHGRCLADEREALAAPAGLPTHARWPSGFEANYIAARPGGNRPPEFDAIAELAGDSPQRGYPLRNVGELNFKIKLHENSDSLGEVSQSQALRECYPGATYLHMAQPFEVAAWYASNLEPFIRIKRGAPGRATRPTITTWINSSITASEVIDDHLVKGENGFLAECQMLITERVDGYLDVRAGEFRSYRDLRQHNPHMKPRMRNFRTSGVVLCIDKDWFKQEAVKRQVSDRLRDVFVHQYSVLPHDVGSSATNISVRDSAGKLWRGGCVAVFDQTYGSLRLTEKLYLDFDDILKRLEVAAGAESAQESDSFQSTVLSIREEFSGFSSMNPFAVDTSHDFPKGHEQVFAQGSRVCFRERGFIGTEVEIIQPTIMDGKLMYQVQAQQRRGQSTMKRWIPASAVEPSAEADTWEYAWWNRETETYEAPSDDAEASTL